MKKFLFIVLAMAVALSFGAPAMAKNGLSVGFGLGFMPNAGSLANTIVDDGLTQSLSPAGYDEVTLVEAEDSLRDSESAGAIKDLEISGPMNAMDFGLQIRYDMFKFFFVRTGFNYATKIMGGQTTWKKAGSTVEQEQKWGYSHWAIPLTLGINIPIAEGKYNVYLGFSIAYMSGGWKLEMTRNYFNSVTGALGTGLTNAITMGGLDPDGASETVEFKIKGIGMGYLLGVDAEVINNLSIFLEVESLVFTKMDQYEVEHVGLRNAGVVRFNKYTVVGGSFLRVGAKYNLGFGVL